MKWLQAKILPLLLAALFCGSPVGRCYGSVDIDLTVMSSTMIYSTVYNIVNTPHDYEGKIIKLTGSYTTYPTDQSGLIHACIVRDAAGCCASGLEFRLAYPQAYPPEGSDITLIALLAFDPDEPQPTLFLKDAEFRSY